jgi:hypothetical protein
MKMINLKPLDDAIAWAEREQAGQHVEGEPIWKQTYWLVVNECGTACCIAGRIALDAGYVPTEIGRIVGHVLAMRHPETGHQDDPSSIAYRIVLGDYADDPRSAPCEAMVELTAGGNDLDDIRAARDELERLAASGW